MSLLRLLKTSFLLPLRSRVPTVAVGTRDHWDIVDPGTPAPFVISAGVGHSFTFEQDLARRWNARVVMLDPSPTGRDTVARTALAPGIEYLPVGLNAVDGETRFALPARAEEGSFSMAQAAGGDTVSFECRSLKSLMQAYGRDEIDILKMDIEGFEYPVLDAMLAEGLKVRQICVEIHTRHGSGVDAGLSDAVRLILRLHRAGFRVVFNSAMDFTFCHRQALP